jgi:hypothetical protein
LIVSVVYAPRMDVKATRNDETAVVVGVYVVL